MDAGEAALARGRAEEGFSLLMQAARAGASSAEMPRLVLALSAAGHYCNRAREVLDWLSGALSPEAPPAVRAVALRAQVALWRSFDVRRVEELAAEAMAAAEAAEDEESFAAVLSCAAGAAYRRGRVREASDYAELANGRKIASRPAQVSAFRTNMFAAMALGDLEQALHCAIKARAIARELGLTGDIADESNNVARIYLDLGCPIEARACAEEGIRTAAVCGFEKAGIAGHMLAAAAAAESGDIDWAIERLEGLPYEATPRLYVDAIEAHAYWLLERGAEGDSAAAEELARRGIERAQVQGMANLLTPLYGSLARSLARRGLRENAREALELARQAADRTEPKARLLLALAAAEVLPAADSKRKMVLNQARARILRTAGRREDPLAYCAEVRINRRLLELSGGVPPDLPRAQ
ncbi:hypothetical protein [Haliangium ochraceum]|uniref:hypothetical protein n=1 Tax=Haliangium ochraceum TaxID=80816 RepID=UPI00019B9D48|nr:hypothetical protein [Haliangium ochraceum]